MEGIIVFIIFAVIISAFTSAAKNAKKAANQKKPPVYPQFPPLSFDAPSETNRDTARDYSGYDNYEETNTIESITENIEGSPIAADTRMENRMLNMDMTILKENIAPSNTRKPQNETVSTVVNRIQLFANRDELVKALIYSEVMQPKFKQRRIR